VRDQSFSSSITPAVSALCCAALCSESGKMILRPVKRLGYFSYF